MTNAQLGQLSTSQFTDPDDDPVQSYRNRQAMFEGKLLVVVSTSRRAVILACYLLKPLFISFA